MKQIEIIKKVWNEMELSCIYSISPEKAKEFLNKFKMELDKKFIYTKNRYREMSNEEPRVDCKDLLIEVCKKFNIKPNKKSMEIANSMLGEGSYRTKFEKAYLGD